MNAVMESLYKQIEESKKMYQGWIEDLDDEIAVFTPIVETLPALGLPKEDVEVSADGYDEVFIKVPWDMAWFSNYKSLLEEGGWVDMEKDVKHGGNKRSYRFENKDIIVGNDKSAKLSIELDATHESSVCKLTLLEERTVTREVVEKIWDVTCPEGAVL